MKNKIISFVMCVVTSISLMLSAVSCSGEGDFWTQFWCNHDFSLEKVITSPTCSTEGEKEMTCSLCSYVKTEKVEKLAHTYEHIAEKPASCTETGLEAYKKCMICGAYESVPKTIPYKGHSQSLLASKEPTCLETGLTEGFECSDCGEMLKAQETIPAKGHTLVVEEGKESTCMQVGYTNKVYCADCGVVYMEKEEIARLPHVDGNDDFKCDVCNNYLSFGLTEVTPTAGESIVGNWYRFYRPETQFIQPIEFSVLDGAYNTANIYISSLEYNYYYATVFMSGPLYTIEGLPVVYTDDYIDICFVPGDYNIVYESTGSVAGTCTIDDTWVINSNYNGSELIYKLV